MEIHSGYSISICDKLFRYPLLYMCFACPDNHNFWNTISETLISETQWHIRDIVVFKAKWKIKGQYLAQIHAL